MAVCLFYALILRDGLLGGPPSALRAGAYEKKDGISRISRLYSSKTDYHFNYLKKSQKSPQMLLPPLFLPLLPLLS